MSSSLEHVSPERLTALHVREYAEELVAAVPPSPVLIEGDSGYPERPSGLSAVVFVGATDLDDAAVDGDVWIDTSS